MKKKGYDRFDEVLPMKPAVESLNPGDMVIMVKNPIFGGTGKFMGTHPDGRVRVRCKVGEYGQTDLLIARSDLRKIWEKPTSTNLG